MNGNDLSGLVILVVLMYFFGVVNTIVWLIGITLAVALLFGVYHLWLALPIIVQEVLKASAVIGFVLFVVKVI